MMRCCRRRARSSVERLSEPFQIGPARHDDQNEFTDQIGIGCMIKMSERILLLPTINRHAMFGVASRARLWR
jgi:hypothetical protein